MDKVIKNEYMPDYVSPPGDTLLEVLHSQGIKQVTLSERIGRSKKFINEIIKGKENISPEVALQLERVLGIPSSFWNNRQRRYDDYLARIREEISLREHLEWIQYFPYNRMSTLNWVSDTKNKMNRLRNLLDFFGVASPSVWEEYWHSIQASYRVSPTFKPDKFALAAWLRQGELIAQSIDCLPYNEKKFRECLTEIRALTAKPPEIFQDRLIKICASCGVAVAFVRELPKTASGATRWLTPQKALLQLSLRYKTDDHLWFTFFHEAAHILFLHDKKKILIEHNKIKSDKEAKANKFAAEFLIPIKSLEEFSQSEHLSKASIKRFASSLGIAPGIVVGQLQKYNLLPWTHCNDLKRRFEWTN